MIDPDLFLPSGMTMTSGFTPNLVVISRRSAVEAVKAAYAAGLASTWQPIETAPKDGSPVDLWARDSWDEGAAFIRMADCTWYEWPKEKKALNRCSGEWLDSDGSVLLIGGSWPLVTHWMRPSGPVPHE